MKLKHLVNTDKGSVSSWTSGVADHHTYMRLAKALDSNSLTSRFVTHTELAPTNVERTEKEGKLFLEERTYFEIKNEWVTTKGLELIKAAGVSVNVSQVEFFGGVLTDVVNNIYIKCAFVAWNISLIIVLLNKGL